MVRKYESKGLLIMSKFYAVMNILMCCGLILVALMLMHFNGLFDVILIIINSVNIGFTLGSLYMSKRR
jgi:hypothetical protein